MRFYKLSYYAFSIFIWLFWGEASIFAEFVPENQNINLNLVRFESSLEKNQFDWGDTISLATIFINNTSAVLRQADVLTACPFTVFDDTGTTVSYSAYWWVTPQGREMVLQQQNRERIHVGSRICPTIDPGTTWKSKINNIENLVDLTLSGTYTIVPRCVYSKIGVGTGEVVLATSTLTITSPPDFGCAISTSTHVTSGLSIYAVEKKREEVLKNKAIQLGVCFVNMPTSNTISNHPTPKTNIMLKPTWAGRFYEVMIEGPGSNQTVPLTRYGHSILDPGTQASSAATKRITVPAGSEVSHALWLNRIFDMTVQGEYQVWAKCTATTADGKTEEYVSDKITVSVQ
jgi:hypothetical protein